MELVAVAAVSENGVIGDAGELPWPSVPADRRMYRARVAGQPVILGRRTFESMRDDLPGGTHIVLTTDPNRRYDLSTVLVVGSVDEALATARGLTDGEVFVLGGGAVYAAFLPHLDQLILSRIPGRYEGDTRFPEIDPVDWRLVRTEPQCGFTLETWQRVENDDRD